MQYPFRMKGIDLRFPLRFRECIKKVYPNEQPETSRVKTELANWFLVSLSEQQLFWHYDSSWHFARGDSSISNIRQLAMLKWRFISGGFVCTHLNVNLTCHKLCLRAGTLWNDARAAVRRQVFSLLILLSLASTHFDTYN